MKKKIGKKRKLQFMFDGHSSDWLGEILMVATTLMTSTVGH